MDKELQILNINGEAYSISDKQSREDIKQIKGKSFITSTSLNTDYEEATKNSNSKYFNTIINNRGIIHYG